MTCEPREAPIPAPATISVRVCFEPSIARWVRERSHDAFAAKEPVTGDDGQVMLYRVHTPSELAPWLPG